MPASQPSDLVGLTVQSGPHRGATVAEVRVEQPGPHAITWMVLDRPHPLGGRVIVGAEDERLGPPVPRAVRPDVGAWA